MYNWYKEHKHLVINVVENEGTIILSIKENWLEIIDVIIDVNN